MQNKEKSIALKTMEDGPVLLHSVSFVQPLLGRQLLRLRTHLSLAFFCDLFDCLLFFFAQNSVNAQEPKIPYPWLVFNEKVKVNAVFLRDSTAVSDSIVLLFGGDVSRGGLVCSCSLCLDYN